jgi:hypothetical protein
MLKPAEGVVSVLPLLTFLIIPPIWLLRARSIRGLVLHNTPAVYLPGRMFNVKENFVSAG